LRMGVRDAGSGRSACRLGTRRGPERHPEAILSAFAQLSRTSAANSVLSTSRAFLQTATPVRSFGAAKKPGRASSSARCSCPQASQMQLASRYVSSTANVLRPTLKAGFRKKAFPSRTVGRRIRRATSAKRRPPPKSQESPFPAHGLTCGWTISHVECQLRGSRAFSAESAPLWRSTSASDDPLMRMKVKEK
jgi:hypothetical protein